MNVNESHLRTTRRNSSAVLWNSLGKGDDNYPWYYSQNITGVCLHDLNSFLQQRFCPASFFRTSFKDGTRFSHQFLEHRGVWECLEEGSHAVPCLLQCLCQATLFSFRPLSSLFGTRNWTQCSASVILFIPSRAAPFLVCLFLCVSVFPMLFFFSF